MSSLHRNRYRRPGRREAFRDPRPIILIVCEGKKTEPEYFGGFSRACQNPRVRLEIAPEHGVPRTVVETARDYKRRGEIEAKRERDENLAYDAVWCVFDVDEHPNVGEALEMARDNAIDVALSNPCFELWLLLHFRDNPGMKTRQQMRELLKVYVPDYDKSVDYRATYLQGYSAAAQRAERICDAAAEDGEPTRNPTTGAYRLTELIRTT
jgi:hypothetical protein